MKAFLVFCALLMGSAFKAQIFTAKPGSTTVTFYSEAPMENIEAANKSAVVVLKTSTRDLQISLSVQNFKFRNALMEEHFNENYMESDKYPKVTFRGIIAEGVDFLKEGEQKVSASGKLDMHGVIRDVTIDGVIEKTGEDIKMHSRFNIRVEDYNIKVPSMYVKNIAEVVDVSFVAVLEPFKKK